LFRKAGETPGVWYGVRDVQVDSGLALWQLAQTAKIPVWGDPPAFGMVNKTYESPLEDLRANEPGAGMPTLEGATEKHGPATHMLL
jgi:hypothetical protein